MKHRDTEGTEKKELNRDSAKPNGTICLLKGLKES